MNFFKWLFGTPPWEKIGSDKRLPGIEPDYYSAPPPIPFQKKKVVAVPRPEWFRVELGEDDRSVTIHISMTKGEVAAANMEFASIGYRSALAGIRNSLQMAARSFQKR